MLVICGAVLCAVMCGAVLCAVMCGAVLCVGNVWCCVVCW